MAQGEGDGMGGRLCRAVGQSSGGEKRPWRMIGLGKLIITARVGQHASSSVCASGPKS